MNHLVYFRYVPPFHLLLDCQNSTPIEGIEYSGAVKDLFILGQEC